MKTGIILTGRDIGVRFGLSPMRVIDDIVDIIIEGCPYRLNSVYVDSIGGVFVYDLHGFEFKLDLDAEYEVRYGGE